MGRFGRHVAARRKDEVRICRRGVQQFLRRAVHFVGGRLLEQSHGVDVAHNQRVSGTCFQRCDHPGLIAEVVAGRTGLDHGFGAVPRIAAVVQHDQKMVVLNQLYDPSHV